MTNVLLIIFTITLLYLGIAHRLLTYIKILAMQGILLFGIVFIQLIEINVINLAFIIIITTFILSNAVADSHISKIYFVVSLSTLFTGLYIIVTRNKIITHIMGYLVIENGVFILSIAVGSEMPMLVNLGILLDIFASVFLLGIFVNKIGDVLKDVDVDQLKNLKD